MKATDFADLNEEIKMLSTDTALAAVTVIESDNACYENKLEAWQTLADTGAWIHLQGWYQRTMWELVANGLVTMFDPEVTEVIREDARQRSEQGSPVKAFGLYGVEV